MDKKMTRAEFKALSKEDQLYNMQEEIVEKDRMIEKQHKVLKQINSDLKFAKAEIAQLKETNKIFEDCAAVVITRNTNLLRQWAALKDDIDSIRKTCDSCSFCGAMSNICDHCVPHNPKRSRWKLRRSIKNIKEKMEALERG